MVFQDVTQDNSLRFGSQCKHIVYPGRHIYKQISVLIALTIGVKD